MDLLEELNALYLQVFQVRKVAGADSGKIFAMKVLKKVRCLWVNKGHWSKMYLFGCIFCSLLNTDN